MATPVKLMNTSYPVNARCATRHTPGIPVSCRIKNNRILEEEYWKRIEICSEERGFSGQLVRVTFYKVKTVAVRALVSLYCALLADENPQE